MYTQQEVDDAQAKNKETIEQMKFRLKETLDEKRDTEIELLQAQKNYVRAKNEAKKLEEQVLNNDAPEGISQADRQRLATANQMEERMKVLSEDKQLLQRQNEKHIDDKKNLVAQYDSEHGRLEVLTDDYIGAFESHIDNLAEMLGLKEKQGFELLSQLGQLKSQLNAMRAELEKRFTAEGKLMPKEFQEVGVPVDPEGHKLLIEEAKKQMSQKEHLLQAGRIEQLYAENAMLKEQLKKHGLIDDSQMVGLAEEKTKLLQEQVDQQKAKIDKLEETRKRQNEIAMDNKVKVDNALSAKDQQIAAQKEQILQLKEENDQLQEKKQAPAEIEIKSQTEDLGTSEQDKNMLAYQRSKLFHYEKTVERLEKERSSLQVRATMAEEQLKVLQQHLQQQTLTQVRKIQELQSQLQLVTGRSADETSVRRSLQQ